MQTPVYYEREILLPEHGSFFLFGPRMVGKTTVLKRSSYRAVYNLLDPRRELALRANPNTLLEEMAVFAQGDRIFIDEIQRVPELLNIVQIGIDQYGLDFILSGSSTRKLKRGRANLLGGRALDYKLYPLTMKEMQTAFDLERVLRIGALPKITVESQADVNHAENYLDSYVTTYIKEEIQAEALVRNLGSFQRFLPIAAQSNAQVIEFSNISRESQTPSSTIKEYYQILEDTLLGFFLHPYNRKERKKTRSKFYFFDTGVIRALQNRSALEMDSCERGILFETWLINELVHINEYTKKRLTFSFFKEREHEIDLILSRGGGVVAAVEIKSGRGGVSLEREKIFKKRFGDVPLYTVGDRLQTTQEKMSYVDFLEKFRKDF